MKVTRTSKGRFVLHLGKREKALLCSVLDLYPRVPPAHHQLSRSACLPDQQASQQLLDEALEEQRAENRKQLQALLTDPGRLKETETGCQMTLSPADLEWLLQVLNDIRVGSWVRLGSPEEKLEVLNAETAPHVWAMEVSGYFQMHLLRALEGDA